MSNSSRRRRRQEKAFPWPILIFAGVLLIGAAILLAMNPFGSKGEGGGSGSGGSPKIAVDPAKIDYGYVKFGNDESFKITVTNKGAGVLSFSDAPYIEVLEGC